MPHKFDRNLIPAAPDLSFERALWQAGIVRVAGLDEAGRGALAGPVAAGVVVLPAGIEITRLNGVRDSKQMLPAERQKWLAVILECCLAVGVGMASALEIDEIGIVPATRLAMLRALEQLCPSPQHLLLDYIELPDSQIAQTSLVKGDQRVLSIATASILAKTYRDAWMEKVDRTFPGYGFAVHKGYGTQMHRAAIQRLGLSPIHRRSFRSMPAAKAPTNFSERSCI
jgi:ribonuclease HII